MAVYEVVLNSVLQGRECKNVFHYGLEATINGVLDPENVDNYIDAPAVAEAFVADVFPDIQAVTAYDVTYDSVTVRDIFDDTDGATVDLSGERGSRGDGTAESMPAHDAIAIKLESAGNAGRPGQKRFPGINTSDITDGLLKTGGTIGTPLLTLLATLVAEIVIANADHNLVLVIVKRLIQQNEDGDDIYVLPDVAGVTVLRKVVTALYRLYVSTQNSRKD